MLPHLMQPLGQSKAAFSNLVKLSVIYPSLILLLICSVMAAISLSLCRKGKLLPIPGEQSRLKTCQNKRHTWELG
jgi:hypothetical protein